jgi:hypothetical protein
VSFGNFVVGDDFGFGWRGVGLFLLLLFRSASGIGDRLSVSERTESGGEKRRSKSKSKEREKVPGTHLLPSSTRVCDQLSSFADRFPAPGSDANPAAEPVCLDDGMDQRGKCLEVSIAVLGRNG